MNEKEFNLQILEKLIGIANYVFENLLTVKDGVYTAAELYNQKDALGKDIVMSFSDVETHTKTRYVLQKELQKKYLLKKLPCM